MGSVASIPNSAAFTLEECKAIFGEMYYTDIYENYKNSQGKVPREKIVELSNISYDVFLSHDWGSYPYENHIRVGEFNSFLISKGVRTWYDADKMRGDIVRKMTSGIDCSKIILVFVTKNYIEKVDGPNYNDNCQLEFKYAMRRKSGKLMISICMEQIVSDASKWVGPVGMALGGSIYIDAYSTSRTDEIYEKLYLAIVTAISDNYPAFLGIGMTARKLNGSNDLVASTISDSKEEEQEQEINIIITKFDTDSVHKAIKEVHALSFKKNPSAELIETTKTSLKNLLSALREGSHRQDDFSGKGTPQLLVKFLSKFGCREDDTNFEAATLGLQCLSAICAFRPSSNYDTFQSHDVNTLACINCHPDSACKVVLDQLRSYGKHSRDLALHGLYAIAVLAFNQESISAFTDAGVAEVILSLLETYNNEDSLDVLREAFHAIAKLNAFKETVKLKQQWGRSNCIPLIIAMTSEYKSQDEEFSFYACKAIGSFCYDIRWIRNKELRDLTSEELEMEANNKVRYTEEGFIIDSVGSLFWELYQCGAADVLIDLSQEHGADNIYIAIESLDALARLRGVFTWSMEGRGMDIIDKSVKYDTDHWDVRMPVMFDEKLTSASLTQVALLLKKFGASSERIIISSCKILCGLKREDEFLRGEKGNWDMDKSYNRKVEKLILTSKPSIITSLFDIAKKLSSTGINIAKDEVVAHLFCIVLNNLCYFLYYDEEKDDLYTYLRDYGVSNILVFLLKEFGPSSATFFQQFQSLICSLTPPARSFLDIYTPLSDQGVIELLVELSSKYRYFMYFDLGCCIGSFVHPRRDFFKTKTDQLTLDAIHRFSDTNMQRYLSAGFVRYIEEVFIPTNKNRILATGMEPLEYSEAFENFKDLGLFNHTNLILSCKMNDMSDIMTKESDEWYRRRDDSSSRNESLSRKDYLYLPSGYLVRCSHFCGENLFMSNASSLSNVSSLECKFRNHEYSEASYSDRWYTCGFSYDDTSEHMIMCGVCADKLAAGTEVMRYDLLTPRGDIAACGDCALPVSMQERGTLNRGWTCSVKSHDNDHDNDDHDNDDDDRNYCLRECRRNKPCYCEVCVESVFCCDAAAKGDCEWLMCRPCAVDVAVGKKDVRSFLNLPSGETAACTACHCLLYKLAIGTYSDEAYCDVKKHEASDDDCKVFYGCYSMCDTDCGWIMCGSCAEKIAAGEESMRNYLLDATCSVCSEGGRVYNYDVNPEGWSCEYKEAHDEPESHSDVCYTCESCDRSGCSICIATKIKEDCANVGEGGEKK